MEFHVVDVSHHMPCYQTCCHICCRMAASPLQALCPKDLEAELAPCRICGTNSTPSPGAAMTTDTDPLSNLQGHPDPLLPVHANSEADHYCF